MKHFLSITLLFSCISQLNAQNRLLLNNNVYVVINAGAQIIIANNNVNALALTGTGGNIISEGENNAIIWNVGNITGMYTVPFTTASGLKIPLMLDVTTAGIGNGNIVFSTYGGSTWDNATYLPSDVTSFKSDCCENNSANVIDRFWIINPENYFTKPTVAITFTYIDAEHLASQNVIDEATLFAQRFNPSPINKWGDWYGTFGSANTSANTVSSGHITPANFFRSWTLVNQSAPLPMELTSFTVNCINPKNRFFEWTTAAEKDNDYFTLEKSDDATNWSILAKIPSQVHTSTNSVDYTYISTDSLNNGLNASSNYFRLKQTDFDGHYQYSATTFNTCTERSVLEVKEFPNPNNGQFKVELCGLLQKNEPIEMQLIDVLGRIIATRIVQAAENGHQEIFQFANNSRGVYYLSISSLHTSVVKKIIYQ